MPGNGHRDRTAGGWPSVAEPVASLASVLTADRAVAVSGLARVHSDGAGTASYFSEVYWSDHAWNPISSGNRLYPRRVARTCGRRPVAVRQGGDAARRRGRAGERGAGAGLHRAASRPEDRRADA